MDKRPPHDAVASLKAALGEFRTGHTFAAAFRVGERIATLTFDEVALAQNGHLSSTIPRAVSDVLEFHERKHLHACLRAFGLGRRNPCLLAFGDLTVSHVLAVASLEKEQQGKLLSVARDEQLTVRQLRTAVAGARSMPAKTGRPRTAPVIRTLTGPLAAPHAFLGIDSLLATSPDKAATLLAICSHAHAQLTLAERALRRATERRERARLLIVDCDSLFVQRARRLLRRESYIVATRTSCEEALSRFDPRTRCAIVDLALQDGSGFELARRLKEFSPALRCVFVTSLPDSDIPERLRSATPLVRKGSGLADLRDALARALAESGMSET